MRKVVTFGEIMLRLSPPGFLRLSQTNSFDINYGGGESNVAVSPGVGFGKFGEGYIRIALVENKQRIRQAMKNIKAVL